MKPFCENTLKEGKELVYFRFAKHKPLISAKSKAAIHRLQPEKGFETFITEIHTVIEKTGYGGYYVFDSYRN